MKSAVFLSLISSALAVSNEALPDVSSSESLYASFAVYATANNQVYTKNELDIRVQNFFTAVKDVTLRRTQYPSAVFNLGPMAHMSTAEQREARGLMKPQPTAAVARSCLAKGVSKEEERTLLKKSQQKVGAIPESFSWLDTPGVVGPVLNQGQCGSCWAFSTAESIMAAHAIQTNATTLELSAQEIVDCSHACSDEMGQTVCNQGCNGGWPWAAMDDVIKWNGLATTAAYPYTGVTGTCERGAQTKAFAPIANYTCLSGPTGNAAPGPANEDEMQSFLMSHGPLSMAMDASPLQYYFGGVVDPYEWNPLGCGKTTLDHALLIVGWGVNDSSLWGKQPYWLVKNSWGESWGEAGYFKILRGKNECGLASAVTFPVVA